MAASDFKRRIVKVTTEGGRHWSTEINGTIPEIKDYFRIGRTTNIGSDDDHIVKITKLEFLDQASKADLRRRRR